MKFTTSESRNTTMKNRLGERAVALIDDEKYLPLFRNRQTNYKKEFEASVRMVKNMKKAGKIKNASRYFAKIWSLDNLKTTLKIVREFLNRQVSRLAEKREQARQNERRESIANATNPSLLAQYRALKAQKLGAKFQ